MFKSLKDVKNMIVGFFEAHKQIEEVHYCSNDDFNAIESKSYPNVQVEYLQAPLSQKLIQYRFNISVQDLYNEEYPDSLIDCHDFALLVLRDFIAFLNSKQIEFSGANAVPFEDDNVDRTAGQTMSLIMQFPLAANECETPI